MPLYDVKCDKCGKLEEVLTTSINKKVNSYNCKCGGMFEKVFPIKSPNFNLKYNPQKDICDWQGNKTRYWDDYNKMKAEGKNPRIPALDGDG